MIACASGILGAQENENPDPSVAWRETLGSESFAVRSAAMKEVWAAGTEGLPFLEELIAGDDPELSARALTIARKVRTGITPETPQDVAGLVESYFSSNAGEKINLIETLKQKKQFEIILSLRNLEKIDVVRDTINRTIKEVMPRLIREHLITDQPDDALRLLLDFGADFSSQIQYANLLDTLGRLEDKIKTLRESESEDDQALYLVCLRVKGDAGLLLSEATRLGDTEAAAVAALTLGDHLPYLRFLTSQDDVKLVDRHYLDWSLARAQGDRAKMTEVQNALIHLASVKSPNREGARRNLHRMGYGPKILQLIDEDEHYVRYEYQAGLENYPALLPALGFREGQSLDQWLTDLKKQAEREHENEAPDRALQSLMFATSFYEARGLDEEAAKCLFLVFDLIRGRENQRTSYWLYQAYNRPIAAYKATMKAFAREIIEFDYTLTAGLEGLYSRAEEQEWLGLQLREFYPKMKLDQLLLLSASFSLRHPLVDLELFDEAQAKMRDYVNNSDHQERDLNRLLLFANYRDWEDDILFLQSELSRIGAPARPYDLAITATMRDLYLEAGSHFQKVEISDEEGMAFLFYEKALALKKAELPEAKGFFQKARLFSDGTAATLSKFASYHGRYGDDEQIYELLRKALLRSRINFSISSFSTGDVVVRELAEVSHRLAKWQEARAFGEVVAWTNNSSWSLLAVRSRFHILLAEGAHAAEKGDLLAAAKIFTRAHSLCPRDGYLANDFFPLLRELGFSELHDQLFAETAREYRKMISLYPKDDNALNNFAWGASRANRYLDEAEEYLKKALIMKPRSGSYLDTMGEIYFARRDRAEAVRWSNLSLKYEMSANELRSQNRRFITGEFPAP